MSLDFLFDLTNVKLIKNRCKHLCCREGLDKPPKPSKRTAAGGAQKGTDATQLTLSASLAGQGLKKTQRTTTSGSDSMYGKRKAAVRVGDDGFWSEDEDALFASQNEQPADSPKRTQLRRKEASRKEDVVDVASTAMPRSQSSSSDYGQFLSPSLLQEVAELNDDDMGKDQKSAEGDANNANATHDHGNGVNTGSDMEWGVIKDEDWPLDSELDSLLDQVTSSRAGANNDGKDTLVESANTLAITSGSSPGQDANAGSNTSSDAYGQKRKHEHNDENRGDDDEQVRRKTKKPNPDVRGGTCLSELGTNTVSSSSPINASSLPLLLPTASSKAGTSRLEGWEDVDPALLEEFKDYADFI